MLESIAPEQHFPTIAWSILEVANRRLSFSTKSDAEIGLELVAVTEKFHGQSVDLEMPLANALR